MPRAPPPKFSSFNRSFKRSSSVGVQLKISNNIAERTRSLERSKPRELFTRLIEESSLVSLEQISEKNIVSLMDVLLIKKLTKCNIKTINKHFLIFFSK